MTGLLPNKEISSNNTAVNKVVVSILKIVITGCISGQGQPCYIVFRTGCRHAADSKQR